MKVRGWVPTLLLPTVTFCECVKEVKVMVVPRPFHMASTAIVSARTREEGSLRVTSNDNPTKTEDLRTEAVTWI